MRTRERLWCPAVVVLLAGSAQSLHAGSPFPAALELSSLDGTNGYVLNGIDADDRSGTSVSSAGDVNGDGVDDLIIGAWGADFNGNSNAGESYVVFGGAGVGASGTVELSALNGVNGFVIIGIDEGNSSGHSVSCAGDVNSDGVVDLIIGAHRADPNGDINAGESYVIFGGADLGGSGVLGLSSLNGTNGFVINGIDTGDRCGFFVASAGDVNNDGAADLIIGARDADPNGINNAGESYVVFGGAGVGSSGVIELSALNGANGFVINGIDLFDISGDSVSSAWDINGDGVDDLIIGADKANPNGNSDAGESYVVFGRCAPAGDLNGDDVVDTADLGVLISQFGTAGPGADVNGDGVVDGADLGILIGQFGLSCP